MHPLDPSRFGVLVLSCSLSVIIALFVHSLRWLSCFARAAGALGVRLWEIAF